MNRRRSFKLVIMLAALVAAVGVVLALQRQETIALRRELALAHASTVDLERLRAENRRLREGQVPAAELATLRADHAALPRLSSELDALTQKQPTAKP
jgi:hypothetical protein